MVCKSRLLMLRCTGDKSLTQGPSAPLATRPTRRRVPIAIVDSSSSTQNYSSHIGDERRHSVNHSCAPALRRDTSHRPRIADVHEAETIHTSDPQRPTGGIFRHNGNHTIFNAEATVRSVSGRESATSNDATAASPILSSLTPPQRQQDGSLSTVSLRITLFALTRGWYSRRTASERWKLLLVRSH